MAPTFLSLPTELRLQIYRCLLCHDEWIQMWSYRKNRELTEIVEKARSGSQPRLLQFSSLEKALLRTCRKVYDEAMPIMYGENTFLYSCNSSIAAYQDNYWKVDIQIHTPDVHLRDMKHVKLQFDGMHYLWMLASGRAASGCFVTKLRLFSKLGCKLQTFELMMTEIYDGRNHQRHRNDRKWHPLYHDITILDAVKADLVKLSVSEALTLTLVSLQRNDIFDPEVQISQYDRFQILLNLVAAEKKMPAIEKKSSETEVALSSVKATRYEMSWCLRPQHSK